MKGGAQKGGTVGNPVFAEPRFKIIADAMGQVPIVSGAMGAVAGFPAGRLVASHFSVMTKHTAQVLIGGPALVERALGVSMSKDELGGAEVHARSGIVDKALFFYAPKILGGDDGIPICRGPGPQLMKDCIRAKNIRVCRFDDDVMIEAYIENQ